MINAILVKHLFDSESEKYDIHYYNEIVEMLHTDITEYIMILQCSRNIYSIVQNVSGLTKLLGMIVSEGNTCLLACHRIQEIYAKEVFDYTQFEKNMQIIRAFDVNEYLFCYQNA